MTRPASATRGLVSIFGSTFVELIGYFMLLPMLLFQLKTAGVSTSVAGLFAATGYLGMFLMTPFASAVTQRLGRRATLWVAAAVPALAAVGFALTDALPVWFALKLISGAAAGLRWVLAEALIAEFSPPGQRGRYVGIFETLVGFTFVIGPAVLAWLGTDNPHALWWVIGFLLTGLAWSLLIPPLPRANDAHSARVGLGGVWQSLLAHPIIMLAGFMGGFFESGMASILPLYGLALGLSAATAALLVSCIGLGSALTMLPAGLLADRFDDQARGRRSVMLACAAITLAAACTGAAGAAGALAGLAYCVHLGRGRRQPVHHGHDRHRRPRKRHHPGQQHRRAGAHLHPGRPGRLVVLGRADRMVTPAGLSAGADRPWPASGWRCCCARGTG